jgi:hypothetical protein
MAALLTAAFPTASVIATGQEGLFGDFFTHVLRVAPETAGG